MGNILKYILFLSAFFINIYAVEIDKNSSRIDLMSHSSIYLDTTNKLPLSIIKNKEFKENKKDIAGFGFLPETALWIKIDIKNTTNESIKKIIEFKHPIIENVTLFSENKQITDGTLHISDKRESINPSFKLYFKPYENKTIYFKAYSKTSSVTARILLYNYDDFIKVDFTHKIYIFAFFTALMILFIYNAMLYIFTKEKAYLYYIMYLFGMIFFQGFYTGFSQLYLLSDHLITLITKGNMAYIGYLMFTMVLFTREFLETKQFPILDKILKYYIYTIPFIIILCFDNFILTMDMIVFYVPLGVIVIFTGYYSYFKGVEQAKFYMYGWSFIIVALIFVNLKAMGIYDITNHFAYLSEFAFVSEALLFSIALAHKIKITNKEKQKAQGELIEVQKNIQKTLEHKVEQRTGELKDALSERELLLKELHHRVKNNMQMIMSLLRIQSRKTKDSESKEGFVESINRINAMSKIHELLYTRDDMLHLNTNEYISTLVQDIKQGFAGGGNINIKTDIKIDLPFEQATYIGLIINELVSNSFKYAFNKNDGEIHISLVENEGKRYLQISDNGKGFDKNIEFGLGLDLVEALVINQLGGEIKRDSSNSGTYYKVVF